MKTTKAKSPQEIAEERMNKAISKAKAKYSVALKSLASDFSVDVTKRRVIDIDKDMIKDFLENPIRYKTQLLDLSLNMYIAVPQYQALVKYFHDMIYLTPYVLPIKTGGGKSKIRNDWEKACYEIEKMNIDLEFRKAISNTILNGVFYGYEIEENDSYTIKHLDPRYCRVYGCVDGCWLYEFNFSYFDSKTNQNGNELLINSYPKEFQQLYKNYQKDRRTYLWQRLDANKQICLRYFPELNAPHVDFPPYANLFADIMDLQDYKSINKAKNEMSNYQFLALEMETNGKDGEMNKFTVNPTIVSEYYDFLTQACGDFITPFISPVKVTPISFTNSNTNLTSLEDAEKAFWNASTVSNTMMGTGIRTGSGLKYSTLVDQNRIKNIFEQVGCILTRKCKCLDGINKNNIFKVKLPFLTEFNKDDEIASALSMAQYGIVSRLELFAMKGHSPSEVMGILLLENDILDLVNKLRPLQSSFTTSGEEFDEKQNEEVIEDITKDNKDKRTRGRPNEEGDSNEDNEGSEQTTK